MTATVVTLTAAVRGVRPGLHDRPGALDHQPGRRGEGAVPRMPGALAVRSRSLGDARRRRAVGGGGDPGVRPRPRLRAPPAALAGRPRRLSGSARIPRPAADRPAWRVAAATSGALALDGGYDAGVQPLPPGPPPQWGPPPDDPREHVLARLWPADRELRPATAAARLRSTAVGRLRYAGARPRLPSRPSAGSRLRLVGLLGLLGAVLTLTLWINLSSAVNRAIGRL